MDLLYQNEELNPLNATNGKDNQTAATDPVDGSDDDDEADEELLDDTFTFLMSKLMMMNSFLVGVGVISIFLGRLGVVVFVVVVVVHYYGVAFGTKKGVMGTVVRICFDVIVVICLFSLVYMRQVTVGVRGFRLQNAPY